MVASGCAQDSNNNTGAPSNPESSGAGLEITEFRAADSTLAPDQTSKLLLTVKNHNPKPVNVEEVSIINTGSLEVGERSCGDLEIDRAREGIKPVLQCSWQITAPSEDDLGAFERKTLSFNLNMVYKATLVNAQPLKVEFRDPEEIDSVEKRATKFSNADLSATMTTESPAPTSGTPRILTFSVKETGPGSLRGGLDFSYQPEGVLADCPPSKENIIGNEVEFSCDITSDTASTRNLFVSTHYKYAKAPTLDIEVVKPE